jgi:hypothetical protein
MKWQTIEAKEQSIHEKEQVIETKEQAVHEKEQSIQIVEQVGSIGPSFVHEEAVPRRENSRPP